MNVIVGNFNLVTIYYALVQDCRGDLEAVEIKAPDNSIFVLTATATEHSWRWSGVYRHLLHCCGLFLPLRQSSASSHRPSAVVHVHSVCNWNTNLHYIELPTMAWRCSWATKQLTHGRRSSAGYPSAVFQYHPLAPPSDGIENGFGNIPSRFSTR